MPQRNDPGGFKYSFPLGEKRGVGREKEANRGELLAKYKYFLKVKPRAVENI